MRTLSRASRLVVLLDHISSRMTHIAKNRKSASLADALTPEESLRFAELNGTIEQEMAVFQKVGQALAEVREGRLYREQYATWDEYLNEKLGMTRQHARRLIQAAEFAERLEGKMEPIGSICPSPVNEAQIRPLHRLKDKDRQIEAWLDASASAPFGQPTAKQVAESVRKLLPQAPPPDQPDSKSDLLAHRRSGKAPG